MQMTCISYDDRIWVTGHRGLLGGALHRHLLQRGYRQVLTRTRDELDLRDGAAVARFLSAERPSVIFAAAARVGGIVANSQHGAEFLHDNLQMQNSVIWGAHQAGVRRLIFLGSSCITRASPPAHRRERPAQRSAGSHQPPLRHRQDRRA